MSDITLASLDISMLVPLLVAVVLGTLIGLERSLAGKSAGMRTYALVALGSCVFALIGELVTPTVLVRSGINPLLMASAVVTGIGFIGTGLVLIRDARHPGGLTTATGIWVAAGIGMASAYRFYGLAFAATAITLLIFTVFWRIERYLERIGGYTPVDDERR